MDYYKIDCHLVCENCGAEDDHAGHGWGLDGGTSLCPDCVRPVFNEYGVTNYGVQHIVTDATDWLRLEDLLDSCETMVQVRAMVQYLISEVAAQASEYVLRRAVTMKRDARKAGTLYDR